MGMPSYISFALAFVVGLISLIYRKRLATSVSWTGYYLLYASITQVVATFIMYEGYATAWLLNYVLIVHWGIAYIILRNLFRTKVYLKRLHVLFLIGSVLFFFVVGVGIQEGTFSGKGLTILNLTVPIGCLLYFMEMLAFPEVSGSPLHQGKFWVATGLLFHHLFGFPKWILYDLYAELIPKNVSHFMNLAPDYLLCLTTLVAISMEIRASRKDGFTAG